MSDVQINLVCCEMVIENEIAQGVSQKDIAATYAMTIKAAAQKAWDPDWPRINRAIINRWNAKALERIKTRAFGLLRGTVRP